MKNGKVFLIFAQIIDCGYTLEPLWFCLNEAVLTSTHNLYFRIKIRKNVYPCKSQFYYIKVGCKWAYNTRTCYPDVCFPDKFVQNVSECYRCHLPIALLFSILG